ncbi:tRNA pseudouridine(13) synthase TruD [Salinisphaera hydrothermalis]|uniref:tRNA pseudouridine synthase D n=1 Tax=Salinisphaera hydrothermalis (strain C41B8) TaxID=1304275 RepID=A0A084IJZ5_SALHC|nr:tRNA pseudouridine(13) synthase TruD [Salinisphaera hydrothermalis]KEZ77029.1 tRNA pseudouridine synthase D TruD [Salinisphaera hydrothermalis C41B8]
MAFLSGDAVDVAEFAFVSSAPSGMGRLRAVPADFQVEEICDVELSGEGEHVWLWVEKTGLTTPQAVERLAQAIGVAPRDIGYSGLKDRHAITRQWFSLTWPIKQALPAWPMDDELRVLEARRHGRKLRRGTHRANRFDITIRDVVDFDAADFETRAARVQRDGVPNYFGAQRFGHGGRNIALSRALFSGRRLSRGRRSFALSAARSLLFNAVLDARLRAEAWPDPLPGDVFMLAGSRSVFAAADTEEPWASLRERAAQGDIQPTGPMPGRARATDIRPTDAASDIEDGVLAEFAEFRDGLERFGVDAERRALRLPVSDLAASAAGADVRLVFTLPAGSFATSVIRELVRVADMSTPG